MVLFLTNTVNKNPGGSVQKGKRKQNETWELHHIGKKTLEEVEKMDEDVAGGKVAKTSQKFCRGQNG